ncbi:MAG: hypothetical protein ACK559_25210, partial [bacterium]
MNGFAQPHLVGQHQPGSPQPMPLERQLAEVFLMGPQPLFFAVDGGLNRSGGRGPLHVGRVEVGHAHHLPAQNALQVLHDERTAAQVHGPRIVPERQELLLHPG